MRYRNKYALSEGIDLPMILGSISKEKALPVKVTVDITPELKNTLLGFAGILTGAIVVTAVVRHSMK